MRPVLAVVAVLSLAAVVGCTSPHITDPPRSATEQLLISTAADLAMKEVDLKTVAGRRAFVDATAVDGTDKAYVVGAVTERVNAQGALLAADKEHAEVVVAVRTGALSVDRSEFLLGIPQLLIPLPFGGTIQSPELALLKKVARRGIAKIGVHAYETPSGKHLLSVGPVSGRSYYTLWTIMLLTWDVTNIPEKN